MNTMKGYVYFAQEAGGDLLHRAPVKIGLAVNVDKRIASLQSANPRELRAVLVVKCETVSQARSLEQLLHRLLASDKTRGEWFVPHGEVDEWVLKGLQSMIDAGRKVIDGAMEAEEGRVDKDALIKLAETLHIVGLVVHEAFRISWTRFSQRDPEGAKKAWEERIEPELEEIEGSIEVIEAEYWARQNREPSGQTFLPILDSKGEPA